MTARQESPTIEPPSLTGDPELDRDLMLLRYTVEKIRRHALAHKRPPRRQDA